MIRIGIIGAGANTRLRHIPGLQAIPGVSVDVVCNRSEASSRKAADEFSIPRIAADWRQVVADDNLDAVCIGTWPYLHAPIAMAALRAGKHVLTEARMAMNAGEAREMLAVSRECPDRVAQIVPSPFTLNWDATIRQMLQSGEIGELRELNFVKTMPAGVDASAPLTWRQDSRYSGHNMMMLGIYYEGARRWVERDPKWVWAKGKVFTTSRMDPESGQPVSIEIPETISLVGEYEDGAWISGHMSVLELGPCRDGFHINGSKGCLRLDVSGDRLFKTPLGGEEEEVMIPQDQKRGWQVEAEFIASIKGAPVLRTNFADGLAYMRFTDAVYESVTHDGKRVAL